MPAHLEDSAVATGLEKVSFHSNSRESESEIAQSCLTLCDLMDYSLSVSSIHGSFQARVLEWIAISFSRGSSRPRKSAFPGSPALQADALLSEPMPKNVQLLLLSHFSRVRLFATPWTIVYETPPSMEFSKQENWSGLPFPSPGALPNPGIEPMSPALQADAFIT